MWHEKYIGIPYVEDGREEAGLDCWGLARYVVLRERDIRLPEYLGSRPVSLLDAMRRMIKVEVEQAQPFDCILFNYRFHIGLITNPGQMLHTDVGIDACLERYDSPIWQPRIIGIYRA